MEGHKLLLAVICFTAMVTLCHIQRVEGRYLPTRSNTDRIDKLKELLREIKCDSQWTPSTLKSSGNSLKRRALKLLENEIEKDEYQQEAAPRWHPDSKLFYKREIPARH